MTRFLQKVPFFSEKFTEVTILFSDIVTFTNIAAAVQPIEIVNMLNELYSKFDNATNANDVYKVYSNYIGQRSNAHHSTSSKYKLQVYRQ